MTHVTRAAGAGAGALPTWQMLARAFRHEGVDTCFALLGDANMNWATALADLGTRMIHVRHEHSAVAAAMAWARKTGRV
ncbi:MAG: acetolactate synthase large subunit, partial [Rhodobacterales bacterium]|nr:acetolactate synthase large subunit [Rhodobacterales bacterium]